MADKSLEPALNKQAQEGVEGTQEEAPRALLIVRASLQICKSACVLVCQWGAMGRRPPEQVQPPEGWRPAATWHYRRNRRGLQVGRAGELRR